MAWTSASKDKQRTDNEDRAAAYREWRYKGDDSGCLSFSIWEAGTEDVSLDLSVGGDDLGLDAEGFQRLTAIMIADFNDQVDRAIVKPSKT